MDNALKYLDPQRKGVIKVSGLPPGAGDDRGPGMQTYVVKDNGLGIPPGCREKIFQAFQRIHTNVAPGEGMGLAIVRRIVERHGGQIWVDSTEGEGSEFLFSLPCPSIEAAAAEPPKKA